MNSAPAGSETKESPAAAPILYGGYGRLGAEAAGGAARTGYAVNPIGRYNAPVGSETKYSYAAAPILYSGSGGLGAAAAGGTAERGYPVYPVHPIGRRDVSTEDEAEKETGADNGSVKKTEKKGKKTKKVAATSTV